VTKTAVVEKRGKRHYTTMERERGLTLFALAGGNERGFNELCENVGLSIPWHTARTWAYDTQKERYAQIKKENEGELRMVMADANRGAAILWGDVARKAAEKLDKLLDEDMIDPAKLSPLGRDATVAMGINTDKYDQLEGRPLLRAAQDFVGMLREFKELTGCEFVITPEQSVPELDEGSPAEP